MYNCNSNLYTNFSKTSERKGRLEMGLKTNRAGRSILFVVASLEHYLFNVSSDTARHRGINQIRNTRTSGRENQKNIVNGAEEYSNFWTKSVEAGRDTSSKLSRTTGKSGEMAGSDLQDGREDLIAEILSLNISESWGLSPNVITGIYEKKY